MLIALAVLAALETASPPVVELTLTGAAGAPVSAAPRTLSDFARERREGRTAVGGFSAVETTVSRAPVYLLPFEWEDETNAEPGIVPGPEPPGIVVPYVGNWNSGWWGGAPARRHPHVRPIVHPVTNPGGASSPRAAATPVVRPFAHTSAFEMQGASRRP
jgi:hypothetical protein